MMNKQLMKNVLLLLLVSVALAVTALAQARTADSLVDSPFSALNTNNPRVGSVRNCINCRRADGPCVAAGVGETLVGASAIKLSDGWHCSSNSAAPASVTFAALPTPTPTTAGEARWCSNCLQGSAPCTAGGSGALAISNGITWSCPSLTSIGGGGTWGSIIGTLSSQSDLINALNLKSNLASPVFTGTVTSSATRSTTLTVDSALNSCADAGSTDDYACSLSPAPSAYTTGQIFWFKANTANVGAATANFSSLGVRAIRKVAGGIATVLVDNDIRAGQWVGLQYDGTNFQMQTMLGNTSIGAGDALVANPLSQFAATTSAQIAGVVTNETGSGLVVFGTSPNITTPTGIVKGDVGLGGVDNTSDANKPVSTAQQTALDLKVNALNGSLVGTTTAANIKTGTLTVTSALNSCADAGSTDSYACSLSPAPTTYTTGQNFWFKANTANTGAATVDFNGLGALAIKKVTGGITTDLATNDIRAGQWVALQYDGSAMQMQSMLGNVSVGDVSSTASITDNAVVRGDGGVKGVQSSGVTIDDSNNFTVPGAVSTGDGTVAGEVKLFELTGNGSNYWSLLAPDLITNTLALKFPNADPTAGQVLSFGAPVANVSTGAWVLPATADSTTIFTNKSYDTEATGNVFGSYFFIEFTAAGSSGGTAAPFLNIPAANGPAAGSIAGSNVIHATLDFDAATDESVQGSFWLPADWTGNIDLDVEALANETGTNVARLGLQTICVAVGETFDPAFNTAQTFNWTNTGTNQRVVASQTSITLTTCAANERLYFKFYRDADGTSGTDSLGVDLRLEALRFKIRRAQ